MGLFGKYLNTFVPLCPPPGISPGAWLANGGGNYMNPEFNVDGKQVTFNNGTYADYRYVSLLSVPRRLLLVWGKPIHLASCCA